MALSDKKKQAKKQRKQAKRKKVLASKARGAWGGGAKAAAIQYAGFPLHEALGADALDEGITNLVLSRRAPDGSIGAGVFLVDTYCLGVKDAFFTLFGNEEKYAEFKDNLTASNPAPLVSHHPSCFRKLLEGAIDYARDLGFSPHKDYKSAAPMLGDIEAAPCPERFEYGKDGQPLFISGPNDSPARVRKVIDTLERRCGSGNYQFVSYIDGMLD